MTKFTVRNPDFATLVTESFARQGFMSYMGAELTGVQAGHVQVEVPFQPQLSQQHDYFHAAVTAAIVDTSCGYAALTLMPPGSEVLTVEYKINLFAPAHGQRLIAHGRVIRAGKTITVCHGDVYAVTDGHQTHCATLTATMIRVDHST